jgi:CHU_C Type IX secretion signal domain
MKMKNLFLTVTTLWSLLIFSCGPSRTPKVAQASYANACCCNTVFVAGQGSIFIPSAFTPNGDGVNDMLWLQKYGAIKYIVNVKISDSLNNVIFTIDSAYNGAAYKTWNGIANGSIYKGVVNVTCTVIDSANIATNITANSCSYVCDANNTNAIVNKLNCKLNDQKTPLNDSIIYVTKDPCFK